MHMNAEKMGRFNAMVREFADENNLHVTFSHDFDKRITEGEFKMNDIPYGPRHDYVSSPRFLVLWDQTKSLTEACTTIFTHVIREFNLDDANIYNGVPEITKVVFNNPATIILWADGTKTVVKCQGDDAYSKETGLALCIAKKALGNKGNFNEVFKKWIPEEDVEVTVLPVTSVRTKSFYNAFDLRDIINEQINAAFKKRGMTEG